MAKDVEPVVRRSDDNPLVAVAPGPTGWRMITFMLAALAWLLPSTIVWILGLVALVGWRGENGTSIGLLEQPSTDAAVTVASALVVIALGAAVLVVLARWALPGRRRLATGLGVAAAAWLPVVLTLGVAVS